MHFFIIIACFLMDAAVFSSANSYDKCCKTGEYVQEANNVYGCTKNASKRLGVSTKRTDFLGKGVDGECADLTPEFSIFKVSRGKIVERRLVEMSYFPKCCPLNYTYNTALHSCEERGHAAPDYIKETFVKVGLPDCKVIVDVQLNKTIDLYRGIINENGHTEYCLDENEKGSFTMRQCRKDTKVCDGIRCVKKCCPDGQSFVGGRRCLDTYTHGLNLTFSSKVQDPEDPFAVVSNLTCKEIIFMREERYIFNFTKNGVFRYWTNYTDSYVSIDVNKEPSYCFEYYSRENEERYSFFLCKNETVLYKKFVYPLVPKILSCVFLILTILIYFFLNETRTLFGKILMNYCLSVLMLFSLLSYLHTNLDQENITCKILAYLLIYTSTASFTWLNVISFDIWWTVGASKQVRSDLKRMLCYLLYGWGVPTLLTLLIFSLNQSESLPKSYHPFVGTFKCFIEKKPDNYAEIIFVRTPHLVLQLANVIFFIKTIIYYLRGKNELNRSDETTKLQRKSSLKRDKERLSLILKLAVIMGITYIFDVTCAFVNMRELGPFAEYTEIIWDCINCSQGIFIFIIFICKKRIFNDIMKRAKIGNRNASLSSSSNATTLTPMITINRKSTKSM